MILTSPSVTESKSIHYQLNQQLCEEYIKVAHVSNCMQCNAYHCLCLCALCSTLAKIKTIKIGVVTSTLTKSQNTIGCYIKMDKTLQTQVSLKSYCNTNSKDVRVCKICRKELSAAKGQYRVFSSLSKLGRTAYMCLQAAGPHRTQTYHYN